jgi:mannan endo-1,4-beta-mannosidase
MPPQFVSASENSIEYKETEEKTLIVRATDIQPAGAMPWIEVAPGVPYFVTDKSHDWTPIGQNNAIIWPELEGLFRHKDMQAVEAYFRELVQHGITCLRLMLEYCQTDHRYLERPEGVFQPNMIRLWDDLFALCEKYGLRMLITPYDTYWMWRRWSRHPYKKSNGGSCATRTQWLLCPHKRRLIKQRLLFATERWGGSGALFAWDLWNEIHPAQAGGSAEGFSEFITDISRFLRGAELRLHGRAHPQTVSVYSTTLEKDDRIAGCVFQHPSLDFASLHFYEKRTIDNPRNTIDAAISTGRLTREALVQVKDSRPFLDSEHGPIHAYKDRRKKIAEPFDDEYFRHMQWAHLASGGAGGGMRWPYRRPHTLTAGMRKAQAALARFLPLIQWKNFRRSNWNEEIALSCNGLTAFGCGDDQQAILWLLRTNSIAKSGMVQEVEASPCFAHIPMKRPGRYQVTIWDTITGVAVHVLEIEHSGEKQLSIPISAVKRDLAFAIVKM